MPTETFGPFNRITKRGRRKLRLAQAYRDVFSSENGRMVLADLLVQHGLYRPSMDPGASADGMAGALKTAFREGEKNVLLGLMYNINLDHQKLQDLLIEQAEDEGSFPGSYE